MSRIVGITLARNEDRFVKQAVRNALPFFDEFLLVDHGSTDRTSEILREIAGTAGHCTFHRIGHPGESHDLLKRFAGEDVWVFAVDGDEIYDPVRLSAFTATVRAGEFRQEWMVLGNVLHCDELSGSRASGYLAPPSRSITKLYNFAAIESWDGDTPERLHGGRPVFRKGFHEGLKCRLEERFEWAESPLRCLHMCFLPRSSVETGVSSRENIMETYRGGWTNLFRRLLRRVSGQPEESRWKRDRYARGARVTVEVADFFPSF